MKKHKPTAAASAAARALTAARNRKLSPKRRREIAVAAIKARWAKRDAEVARLQQVTDAPESKEIP